MSPQAVEARANATVANLGVGFDILGMALQEPFDIVRAERESAPGVRIEAITGDDGQLSREAHRNTAGIAAAYVLQQIGAREGVRLSVHKGLPLASGLGSSAASAVAAAVAVNALFGEPLDRAALLAASLEGEAAVSGRHADNVAPALFGGITLVLGTTAEAIYSLPIPPNLHLALVTPGIAVPTAQARAVLPQSVPLKAMIHQTAQVALLVRALYTGDLALLGKAMESDSVIEPARAHLMRGLAEVRAAARAQGALGTVISGAGPTLCAMCDSDTCARRVAQAMGAIYAELQLPATVRVTQPSAQGAAWRAV
ncbi:MAG: homoserine kinase [Candidatus Thermofonsia Clade 1 bacterium]|jgi:homoserine kinase|uniref:Homoserine kinase n=1 Tax=Candidatus Thermofonsia Clade 1 bacterium TaxID=2364210 RepID=A0A2M8PCI9_9CHLR|nr:MAG: homoserine kinase [Candidatus Thermofonsia Clade 1 bacterium]RMF50354.1 MAG: homoserine kinase [Chloroflexota bacterium]